jgi:uncharacterized membrane protein YsdA (DUF1294 family)
MVYILGAVIACIAINGFTFLAFGLDKSAARNGERRTPESTLLFLALFGGSVGAIAGQQFFRHKTKKEPFRTRLRTIVLIQGAVVLVAAGYVLAMLLSNLLALKLADASPQVIDQPWKWMPFPQQTA